MDGPGRRRAIECIKVNSRRPTFEKVDALDRSPGNADLSDRCGVTFVAEKRCFELGGDGCSHVLDSRYLPVMRYRHYTRKDRHVDAARSRLLHEAPVELVIEEELGDEKGCAASHLS